VDDQDGIKDPSDVRSEMEGGSYLTGITSPEHHQMRDKAGLDVDDIVLEHWPQASSLDTEEKSWRGDYRHGGGTTI